VTDSHDAKEQAAPPIPQRSNSQITPYLSMGIIFEPFFPTQ